MFVLSSVLFLGSLLSSAIAGDKVIYYETDPSSEASAIAAGGIALGEVVPDNEEDPLKTVVWSFLTGKRRYLAHPPGIDAIDPRGVDSLGRAVGVYSNSTNLFALYYDEKGARQQLVPVSGYHFAQANAISAAGIIVGSSTDSDKAKTSACYWTSSPNLSNGKTQWVASKLPSEHEGAVGRGLNAALTVSENGAFIGGRIDQKPAIWVKGPKGWDSVLLSTEYGQVTHINSQGEAVGFTVPSGKNCPHAFYADAVTRKLQYIDPVSSSQTCTEALGIGPSGLVVGNSFDLTHTTTDGFVWNSKGGSVRLRIAKDHTLLQQKPGGVDEGLFVVLKSISSQGYLLGQSDDPTAEDPEESPTRMFVYQWK